MEWIVLRDTRTGRSTRVKNQRNFDWTGTITKRQFRAAMNRLRCFSPDRMTASTECGCYVERYNGRYDCFIGPEIEGKQ